MPLAHNVELDDIDTRDYPDFCDAYITYAEHKDGTPLTEAELEALNGDKNFVYQCVINQVY
jgi:hypothetical protein